MDATLTPRPDKLLWCQLGESNAAERLFRPPQRPLLLSWRKALELVHLGVVVLTPSDLWCQPKHTDRHLTMPVEILSQNSGVCCQPRRVRNLQAAVHHTPTSNLVDLLSSLRAFATRPCEGLLLVDMERVERSSPGCRPSRFPLPNTRPKLRRLSSH